jgi:hypothetical protein
MIHYSPIIQLLYWGQFGIVGVVTRQGAGWTRDKVLVGGALSSPDISRLALGPIHPPFQWAQGFFFGDGLSMILITFLHLVPKLRCGAVPLPPPCACMACIGQLYSFLYYLLIPSFDFGMWSELLTSLKNYR